MRSSVCATVVLVLGLFDPGIDMPRAQARPPDEGEVRRVQNDLIDAYLHNDVAALERILADEFTFTDDRGTVHNKRQVVDSFKSGDRRITSYKLEDSKVRVYENVAVMTYRYRSKETYKGRDDSGDYRITRIFVRKNGRWQIVTGHETKIAPHR